MRRYINSHRQFWTRRRLITCVVMAGLAGAGINVAVKSLLPQATWVSMVASLALATGVGLVIGLGTGMHAAAEDAPHPYDKEPKA